MKVLKFNISGKFACFKKSLSAEVSTDLVLTYDLMPITVLKGLIGAVLGYNGLAKAYRENTKIEYLEKLKDIGIGIVPIKIGDKFFQKHTNTTGFGNAGATLIIKQEILQDISYDIYITNEFEDFDLLYEKLAKKQSKYPLVLGKKGMSAVISNVELLDLSIETGFDGSLQSLFYKKQTKEKKKSLMAKVVKTKFDILLPVDYNKNMEYIHESILFTDQKIEYKGEVFKDLSIAVLR